ncbi:hypothetical protein LZD49_22390 [Dyadobacter sp. CY261]|uniref:hypothetical protein n=1 Tax=Dyadobacter sp. CY261 TaxID=2907203 RepID=UPI001F385454|nr:hypothetical protein [Dyadobacter sp. CY261]MCF0073246.1 hypothetical protein [Dyadobacter sp. CY261]
MTTEEKKIEITAKIASLENEELIDRVDDLWISLKMTNYLIDTHILLENYTIITQDWKFADYQDMVTILWK